MHFLIVLSAGLYHHSWHIAQRRDSDVFMHHQVLESLQGTEKPVIIRIICDWQVYERLDCCCKILQAQDWVSMKV